MKNTITEPLFLKLKELKLHGLISHWEEIREAPWINDLIAWEEKERSHRSLERRLTASRIGRFKPISEFDWNWPKKCDRELIEELMQLNFLKEATNIIFCGPSGVGKSMIALNISYQAVLRGNTALFVTAGEMLNDLSGQDGDNALRRRLKYYVNPSILCIDEMGYLDYCNRRADLLFEIISQRYQKKPTIVTTNKPFSEWGTMFPSAACVVSLIDRLVHYSEIIGIEADSYRFKEAMEKSAGRKESRSKRKLNPESKTTQEAQ